jgi:GNAT superfamily N-acetyltransferase
MVVRASDRLQLIAFDDCLPDHIHSALSLAEENAPARTQAWLMQLLCGDTSFLARHGSAIVGVALGCIERRRPASLYVEKIAVDASLRGRGIARALLQRVAETGAALGCRDMWLTTAPANPACHAWMKLGFKLACAPNMTVGGRP